MCWSPRVIPSMMTVNSFGSGFAAHVIPFSGSTLNLPVSLRLCPAFKVTSLPLCDLPTYTLPSFGRSFPFEFVTLSRLGSTETEPGPRLTISISTCKPNENNEQYTVPSTPCVLGIPYWWLPLSTALEPCGLYFHPGSQPTNTMAASTTASFLLMVASVQDWRDRIYPYPAPLPYSRPCTLPFPLPLAFTCPFLGRRQPSPPFSSAILSQP